MAQKCEHNLASSSLDWKIAVLSGGSAAGSVPHWSPAHICWYGSDKCHLILETEVDYLQLVGSYCGEFYAHQHHRLTWSVFFFCVFVCGILCSGWHSSMQQSLEMRACLKLNLESAVRVLLSLLCENWAVCLCLTVAAFKHLALRCLKTMVDSYFWLMRQYDATGKKSLCSWINNTWHLVIWHNQKTI